MFYIFSFFQSFCIDGVQTNQIHRFFFFSFYFELTIKKKKSSEQNPNSQRGNSQSQSHWNWFHVWNEHESCADSASGNTWLLWKESRHVLLFPSLCLRRRNQREDRLRASSSGAVIAKVFAVCSTRPRTSEDTHWQLWHGALYPGLTAPSAPAVKSLSGRLRTFLLPSAPRPSAWFETRVVKMFWGRSCCGVRPPGQALMNNWNGCAPPPRHP